MYPKAWTSAKASDIPGGVFLASAGDDTIFVDVRPATNFKDAASGLLADLIKAKGLSLTPNVDAENTITLADGKTQASQILLSALFGQVKCVCTGVIKDGNAIIVFGGTKPASMDLYKEMGTTLVLK